MPIQTCCPYDGYNVTLAWQLHMYIYIYAIKTRRERNLLYLDWATTLCAGMLLFVEANVMSTWTWATCEEIAQYQMEKHLICSLVRSSSHYYTAIIQLISYYYACTSSTWWTSEHPGRQVSGIHTPFSSWYLRGINLHVSASWEAPTSLAHWISNFWGTFFFFFTSNAGQGMLA